MPGWSTRSFLANKAVQSLRINQGPTVTFMWHAKSQAKPQTYSDSHCFIIKPTHMRILALPEASLHCVGMKQPGKKPAVPGCSNWTSLELRLPKCRDDPRRVVWVANRLEECQRPTFLLIVPVPKMTLFSHISLTGRQPLALFRTICRQNNPSGIVPAFWQT